MKLLSSSKISKKKAKKGFEYPIIRLPRECSDIIGKTAEIYRVDENKFLVIIRDSPRLDNKLSNRATISKDKRSQNLSSIQNISNVLSSFLSQKENKYLW
ncbi:MAG: hypothetical protein J7K58_01375, partial [Euryarchaeota archaeon]|nr:hypothetical protein [Euryarchaeota archaeon]